MFCVKSGDSETCDEEKVKKQQQKNKKQTNNNNNKNNNNKKTTKNKQTNKHDLSFTLREERSIEGKQFFLHCSAERERERESCRSSYISWKRRCTGQRSSTYATLDHNKNCITLRNGRHLGWRHLSIFRNDLVYLFLETFMFGSQWPLLTSWVLPYVLDGEK